MLKLHTDPITGEELIAYDTTNTEHESDEQETDKCLFVVNAQGINTDIIVNFIGLVDSGKLQLLNKVDQNDIDYGDTDFLIEEVANLQLKTLNGGKLTVERNSKSMDKDRYSACSYMSYYIMTYENKTKKDNKVNVSQLFQFSAPRIRK